MSDSPRDKVVFDCNVYLQFLFNRNGPSGRCVSLALEGRIELFVNDAVLDELRQLPEKPFCLRVGITDSVIEDFVAEFLPRVTYMTGVPNIFEHPVDSDDSDYVNLAIAAGAELIVLRDNHLLNLTNPLKPWSADFRRRFPNIRVIQPPQFLAEWDKKIEAGG